MIGRTLSHYKVLEKIGEGGMGEVYLAKDTKLDREVAVKVLPATFSENKERLARFEREARLLASLNHPNIAAIHELEESDGVHFLALEYVPGETLAERIKRGPIPVDETLPIIKQIAEGLEAAHDNGIIHRDLKPANIKVTPEGKVKILDFGLGKAFSDESDVTDVSQSPTMTREGTRAGVILGTAAYMSPEQARGKPVDKRTDIWAFGCCLYETLTGRKAFAGETVTDVLAAVVKSEPDWKMFPEALPQQIRDLVERCLRKDPAWRLHDVADARIEINEAQKEPKWELPAARIDPRGVAAKIAVLAFVVAVLGVIVGRLSKPSPPLVEEPITRFVVSLPAEQVLGGPSLPFNLSPDGERLVFVAQAGTTQQLYVRDLDDFEATPLPGTEGATNPFFSPDGRWVGFFANAELKKTSIGGRAVTSICGVPAIIGQGWGGGSFWGRDGTIIFSGGGDRGLLRVSADGGTPEQLTTPEGLVGHMWPQMLPDGKNLLFTLSSGEDSNLSVLSLDTGESRVLVSETSGAFQARYVSTGHLVYAHSRTLWAVPFDVSTLELMGRPVSVLDDVYENPLIIPEPANYFSVADNGSMIYVPGPMAGANSLVWVDREGQETTWVDEGKMYANPRLSHDGRRVVLTVTTPEGGDIWIYEVDRGTHTRLTFGGLHNEPVWSPDGARIAFATAPWGAVDWTPTDGSGPAQTLVQKEDAFQVPSSWSPDGRTLTFYDIGSDTTRDIWALPMDGDGIPKLILGTEFNEHSAMFSPDGRWLVYVSDESGQEEVYVRPYPGPEAKHIVSTEGGREPVWSSDGDEIFYRNGDKMMAADVQTDPDFVAGTPRILFEEPYAMWFGGGNNYDVTPDGQRFLMIKTDLESAPREIHVILNWFEELKRLVPTN